MTSCFSSVRLEHKLKALDLCPTSDLDTSCRRTPAFCPVTLPPVATCCPTSTDLQNQTFQNPFSSPNSSSSSYILTACRDLSSSAVLLLEFPCLPEHQAVSTGQLPTFRKIVVPSPSRWNSPREMLLDCSTLKMLRNVGNWWPVNIPKTYDQYDVTSQKPKPSRILFISFASADLTRVCRRQQNELRKRMEGRR